MACSISSVMLIRMKKAAVSIRYHSKARIETTRNHVGTDSTADGSAGLVLVVSSLMRVTLQSVVWLHIGLSVTASGPGPLRIEAVLLQSRDPHIEMAAHGGHAM